MAECGDLRQATATRRLAVGLLAIHAGMLAWSGYRHSPVVGETAQLAAGVSHWELGQYDLYRVNPPLVRYVAALPVVLAGANTDWSRYSSDPLRRAELEVGQDFDAANGPRAAWLYTLARWACIPFSLLGGAICYVWARELYGNASGLLAVSLWVASPDILGHGSLISTDVAAASCGLAAAFAFSRWLRRPTWSSCLTAGLCLGVAQLTKTSLLVLYVVFACVWVVARMRHRLTTSARWLRDVKMAAALFAISLLVINVGYNAVGSFAKLGDFRFQSQLLTGIDSQPGGRRPAGNRFAESWLGALPVPLPRDYVQGIDTQRVDFERTMRSYLGGDWRLGGWWHFYVYALAIKVPVGVWILLALAIWTALKDRQPRAWQSDEWIIALTAIVLFALVSSQTGLSIHHRYALPVMPLLYLVIARIGPLLNTRTPIGWVATTSLVWAIASSLWIYPHSLSYFNESVGGPHRGHRHLIHSGIAWGQDLGFLRDWTERHPEARPLFVASMGYVRPESMGISYRMPPPGNQGGPPEPEQLKPGWYAIDVNHLQGSSEPIPDGQGGQFVPVLGERDVTYFERGPRTLPAGKRVLKILGPVAHAGYSFRIYHVISARQAPTAVDE